MSISITAKEKQILTSVSIPPCPKSLMSVSAEAKKPEPNIKVIADAISEDAAISATVLQVVNSAAFRRVKKIESIHQAVMTLGIKRIFPLVKAVALKGALPENDDLVEFWKSSSMIATACSVYAKLIGKPELVDNAYMLGLFHNAGVPVMLQSFDDYHDLLVKGITDGWEEISAMEQNKYHTSHTTLGALLAQQWQLPKAMVHVIYYFHDTEGIFDSDELSRVGLYLLTILKLARSSVDGILRGECNNQEWLLLEDQILAFLDIDDIELDSMREKVVDALNEE